MSEERLSRIEKRLDGLEADVGVIKADVRVLKADVGVLKADVGVLKTDVADLKIGVASNTTAIEDLRRHMGVLHEDVIGRMRAAAEYDSLRREMQAGFAGLRQILTDHVVVGDAADRQFAAALADHERRIRTLEER